MAFGGASLVYDEALVPAEVLDSVAEVESDILAGLFRVNVNDDEPASTR
jgi:hypothetical protein